MSAPQENADYPETLRLLRKYQGHPKEPIQGREALAPDLARAINELIDYAEDLDCTEQPAIGEYDVTADIRLVCQALIDHAEGRATAATRANLQEAWAALAMIRETIETLAPSGAVKASEHLDGPTFMHEADALVAGIAALAQAQELGEDKEIAQHIGWLKQYVAGMDETNWRDMRLRAERQLESLAIALRPERSGGRGT